MKININNSFESINFEKINKKPSKEDGKKLNKANKTKRGGIRF